MSWKTYLRGLLALVALAAVAWGTRALKQSGVLEQALAWLAGLGAWAPLMFLVIYIITCLCFLPVSVLTLGAGVLWGFGRGSAYILISATIAGIICFALSRHFARRWIAPRLEAHPAFKALDEAVAREGWKIVALVRLTPVFPFAVTSYGFGLTRVPMWQYILCSVAMIPGTMMYVYIGTLLGDLAGLRQPAPIPFWVKGGVLCCAAAVMFYLGRFTRRALKQR